LDKTKIQVHDYEGKLAAALQRLENDTLLEADRAKLRAFHEFLVAGGVNAARRERVLSTLLNFAKRNAKPFADFGKEDVQKLVVVAIESSGYSEWTKYTYKVILKQFFRWLRGCEGSENPPETKWISTKIKNAGRLLPEELLSEEDIKKIAGAAQNPRDKALVMVLYDSGCRIGEILSLRLKDVVADSKGFYLVVNGKTGARRVRLMPSVASLAAWINSHPDRDNPNAALWFHVKSGKRAVISYQYCRKVLERLFARAGVKKRCNPHLFRHSRATFYAAVLPEALLKEQMGWTQSTKMAGVYVHLSGKRVDDAISEAYGQQKKTTKPSLEVKTCPRCDFANGFDAECCERCGTPLDQKAVVLAEADEEEFLTRLFAALVEDAEIKKKLAFVLNKNELKTRLLNLIRTKL